MIKKILLIFTLIVSSLYINAQQCQNLELTNTEINCAFPITTLEASFLNLDYKTTQTYLVNGLTVCPPQQAQPTSADIEPDDAWAAIIFDIGFNFCFYGNTYDQLIVSGNGVLSFELDEVEDYLVTDPNGEGPFHTWYHVSFGDLPTPEMMPNSIFGAYCDPNPKAAPIPTETIKFDLLNQNDIGNRVFVVEYDVPLYGCADEPTQFMHSRIKLYESSNVIDVEILHKGDCYGFSQTQQGRAIVGIQNKSATLATMAPGRGSAAVWEVLGNPAYGGNVAEQELWRFIPDGFDLGYSFKWYADYGQGNGYEELFPSQTSDDPIIEVNPQTQTEYQVVLSSQTECSLEGFTLQESLIVDAPIVENIQAPVDLFLCEDAFDSDNADFNIDQFDTLLDEYINSTTNTWDMTHFSVAYYPTYDDRTDLTNPIDETVLYSATNNTTIYARIIFDDGTISCFDLYQEFDLNVVPLIDTTFNYAESIYCTADSSPLPAITITGGVFTIDNGGVIDMDTGEVNLTASGTGTDGTGIFNIEYTLTNTILDNQGTVILDCPNTTSATISIEITNDADFSFPTDICFSDTTNPQAFDITTSGGIYTVDNGASIDANGVLDLTTTTPGTTYEITYSFSGFCQSSSVEMITVHASPTASTPTTMITECNNGDGTANFDISSLENEIVGNQSNVTLTYHLTQIDAENNVNEIDTTPFARVEGNIWARVESNNGCISIIEVLLIVENCYIVLPGGFSPNSTIEDNRTFNVRNLKIKFPEFKLFIYNRYGNLVYEGDATDENWNGKLNNEGDILPTGTYFYGIKLNDEQELTNRGWVYLQQ